MATETSKDRDAFRTIGELSKELGIKAHILRYWEDQFAMLQPLKRAGSRRHYRPDDVKMVTLINRLLNEEGYTIKGARKYLTSQKSKSSAHAENVADTLTKSAIPLAGSTGEDTGLIVAELKNIRNRLSSALNES
ncbi:MerR family transcriptional regulator [Parasphingorhabdus sp.]|uniref:MerR family transcriptional regulator n=1 Tax=Parasphingorhabdus sp. TaxID=2709688 RepID=UPI003263B1B8